MWKDASDLAVLVAEGDGMERFRACFAEREDPRTGNAQRHELDEIIMIALLATLCGAETGVDMALFGRAKEPLLRRFLTLPGGIPSHDTFSRLFRRIGHGLASLAVLMNRPVPDPGRLQPTSAPFRCSWQAR